MAELAHNATPHSDTVASSDESGEATASTVDCAEAEVAVELVDV